ncbi:hypothetical protein [Paenibacillus silvisoli]|uniref:hypothetical protein n=1 Tax=Paenibacillus silvisoli TaxID=3110539 RepID=UPI0028052260|nr:hypothetical protein [Paenibacillus silvisoli]
MIIPATISGKQITRKPTGFKKSTAPAFGTKRKSTKSGSAGKTSTRKQKRTKKKDVNRYRYNRAFDIAYNQGYNLGFAKGFEDGHQLAYEQQT